MDLLKKVFILSILCNLSKAFLCAVQIIVGRELWSIKVLGNFDFQNKGRYIKNSKIFKKLKFFIKYSNENFVVQFIK